MFLSRKKKTNHKMLMLKCDYMFYINTQYLVFSPNLFLEYAQGCAARTSDGETKPCI